MFSKLFTRFGKRRTIGVAIAVAVIAIVAYLFLSGNDEAAVEETVLATVEVRSVDELSSVNTFSAVGTVSAVSEANLQTEAGGRVTAVNVEIGKFVAAGTVLASIENSRERATLLQAEGSYEAAVAGANQGDSGARDAETSLKSAQDAAIQAVRNAYTDVNSALINSIDPFFSSPETSVPGLRIDGNTPVLSAERVAYQTLMPRWQAALASIDTDSIKSNLDRAEDNTIRTINFVEQFAVATNEADARDTLDGLPVTSLTTVLLSQSKTLSATLSNIQDARTKLIAAEEAVVRSSIAGTNNTTSLANAQVKVALGSLRSAQAAYEKTLVRTPISGVINALYLKAGEYVTSGQKAAIVANNNGLEIVTSVNQDDSVTLTIGDVVSIDGTASGTVTAIAGAVDPTTGKVAVKVSVTDDADLQNGSTVTVLFTKKEVTANPAMTIPLSAIKMTGSGPVTFSVGSDNTLIATPVTLGAISGDSVVIEQGLATDAAIVVDARGLKEGQAVVIENN